MARKGEREGEGREGRKSSGLPTIYNSSFYLTSERKGGRGGLGSLTLAPLRPEGRRKSLYMFTQFASLKKRSGGKKTVHRLQSIAVSFRDMKGGSSFFTTCDATVIRKRGKKGGSGSLLKPADFFFFTKKEKGGEGRVHRQPDPPTTPKEERGRRRGR